MDPEVRFATTSDGARIAYCMAGQGRTMILVPAPGQCHVQLSWSGIYAHLSQQFAEAFRYVWYDARGSGLSDRAAAEFTMDAMLRDLDAIVERAPDEPFALGAQADGVPIAIAYAARHPERVSHLIIVGGWASPSDYKTTSAYMVEEALRQRDPDVYLETMSELSFTGMTDDEERAFVELINASAGPGTLIAVQAAIESWDAAHLLAQVRCPTLVVHMASNRWLTLDVAHRMATKIPNARLVTIDDPMLRRLPQLVDEFVNDVPRLASRSAATAGLQTIVFTDLVGHTAMMQRLGDVRGRELLREHERITRDLLREHGGAEVKTMGDGFMASFVSVTKAMDCAIALQRAFAEHDAVSVEPLPVRVGLNAGEPIAEEGDLFGSTVIMASRVAAQAAAGEILIPEPLRHLLTGKSYIYADRGETMLKGFEDAVRLYEVRWQE